MEVQYAIWSQKGRPYGAHSDTTWIEGHFLGGTLDGNDCLSVWPTQKFHWTSAEHIRPDLSLFRSRLCSEVLIRTCRSSRVGGGRWCFYVCVFVSVILCGVRASMRFARQRCLGLTFGED